MYNIIWWKFSWTNEIGILFFQANELANMTGHSDKVVSVASDTHGNLCTSSLDKSVKLWKPQLTSERSDLGHDTQVTFCIGSTEQLLLTGSR